MSYDLHLVRIPPGADAQAVVDASVAMDEELNSIQVNQTPPRRRPNAVLWQRCKPSTHC